MEKKIRICYVINRLPNAGPVSVIYNLLSNIDYSLYEAYLVTISEESNDSRVEIFTKLPVTLYTVPINTKMTVIGQFKRFKKILREIKPSIVHAHCVRSLAFSILLRRNYRVLYTCHNYPGPLEKVLYGNYLGTAIAIANIFLSGLADKTVTCSESISKDLLKYKKVKVDFINNGVNYPVWHGNQVEKNILRDKLGLSKDVIYFISIGRLSPEKNMEFLVDSFSKINNPKYGLIILGDGDQYERLKKKSNNNILIAGYQSDVRSYVIACDFYVSASDGEGLSMALLESMSVGLPMLLSDISCHRMVMSKFENVVGYIFADKCTDSFSKLLDKMLGIDYEVASDNIKNLYKKMFTSRVMTESYEELYKQLMDR